MNDVIKRRPGIPDPDHPSWPEDYPPVDNYAAANIGQLKQIASKARLYFNSTIGIEYVSETRINADFLKFLKLNPGRDDYAALNQGQLKYTATPYYELLASLGYGGQPINIYPWTPQGDDDSDYSLVTIGQLKQVFSFGINANPSDVDYDGLPDLWESKYFHEYYWDSIKRVSFTLQTKAWEDMDSDGVSNLAEYQAGTHPFKNPALWVAGTLGQACNLAIDSRIAGKTPAVAMPLYTVRNHTSSPPQYVRNSNGWFAAQPGLPAVDLTCISPYNDQTVDLFCGTLVTPRHIIMAAHACLGRIPNQPTHIRFVAMDGTVVDRQIISTKIHANYDPDTLVADLAVGLLDQDVPASISFCKILPANYESYISNSLLQPTGGILALGLDQFEEASVSEVNAFVSSSVKHALPPMADIQRDLFYKSKTPGDSGNPAFIIINNQLTLLNVWTGAGGGSDVAKYAADLNQMIVDLNTAAGITQNYALTVQDITGFQTYP